MSISPELWSVILAGGDGKRILPLIQSWLGFKKPKQYCTFVGKRSLLQHTVARACRISEKERIVIVIDRSHLEYVSTQLGEESAGRLVVQPANRETAPGIYLPLTYIHARSRQAIVVIHPSDQFVYPEDQFLAGVRQAVEAVTRFGDKLVLLAVKPDSVDTEYGWVSPGSLLDCKNGCLRKVRNFIEKPGYEAAEAAYSAGALWNTFVMAASVERLWELGWQFFPEIMALFEKLEAGLGTEKEQEILDSIYTSMPMRNFSSGLLQRVPEHVALIELEGILWSDWGLPERIVASLGRIHKQPAFSPEMLVAGRKKAAGASCRSSCA